MTEATATDPPAAQHLPSRGRRHTASRTDLASQERPEPLLSRQAYAKWITATLPVMLTTAALFGWRTTLDTNTALALAIAIGGPTVGAINWTTVHVLAHRSRALVTPLADPRSVTGEQLITLSAAKALTATNAANAPLEPEGELAGTPWAEDDSVVFTGSPA